MRRHWINRMTNRSIMLPDGFEAVEHHAYEDSETWVRVVIKGVPDMVPVFCGPAAPLPAGTGTPAFIQFDHVVSSINTPFCGAIGPDGARCELNPRHVALPYREDRWHAATSGMGLSRW